MTVKRFNHVVLTGADPKATVDVYTRVWACRCMRSTTPYWRFGDQKINLHEVGRKFEPRGCPLT